MEVPVTEHDAFNQTLYSGENDKYYSLVTLEHSPLNRTLNQYAPGENWVGSFQGNSIEYLINTATDNVRLWYIAPAQGSIPTSSAAYTADKIYKTITSNEKGVQTIKYRNTAC